MTSLSRRHYKVVDPHNPANWCEVPTLQEAKNLAWKKRWIILSCKEGVIGAKVPKD